MIDFRLYAEQKGRIGYCVECIKNMKISPHMIGKNGDKCPMCETYIYTRELNDASMEKSE